MVLGSVQVPSAATVAVPMVLPAGSLTVTCAPASPVPLRVVAMTAVNATTVAVSTVNAVPAAVLALPAALVTLICGV